jgi:VIT1/CCC1 family predicted Fe2+/Mn2+ transporter
MQDPGEDEKIFAVLEAPWRKATDPREKALWMLVADFFSAAIPILPFALMPVAEARIVSALVTLTLLVLLGLGRARIGGQRAASTIAETVSIGIAAALAGVAISMLINHLYA